MFKVNNKNTRTRCEICLKLTIKVFLLLTLNIFFTPCSRVSIVNFEQVNDDWDEEWEYFDEQYSQKIAKLEIYIPKWHTVEQSQQRNGTVLRWFTFVYDSSTFVYTPQHFSTLVEWLVSVFRIDHFLGIKWCMSLC